MIKVKKTPPLKLSIEKRRSIHADLSEALTYIQYAHTSLEDVTYSTHLKRKLVVVAGKIMNLQRDLDK